MAFFRNIIFALTKRERAAGIIAVGALLVSGVALAALFIDEATAEVPARGGEYTEGVTGQPNAVNPVLASANADRILVELAFANIAELADKIEVLENRRQWRVRLKENLRWSNDRKITADDVVFTVQKIQDPETRSPLLPSWQDVSAHRVSELEVQFMTVAPYPFFGEHLRALRPIPKHLFADVPPANWRLSDHLLKPVGSGPYSFEEIEKRSDGFITAYRLAANPRYAGTRPFIERITLRFFPTHEETTAAMNAGVVHGVAGWNLIGEQVSRPHSTWAFPMSGYYAVFLNQVQYAPFKDKLVRQAFDIAVDRSEIVRAALDDRGRPQRGPSAFSEGPNAFPSDPARAAELLDQSGWRLDENGARSRYANGETTTLAFALAVPDVPFLVKTAGELKAQWERLGARVTIAVANPDEVAERAIPNRDYQALLYGNVLNPIDDLYPFWHSNERFAPGLNLAIYGNKRSDGLMERIRRNFDEESRATDLRDLHNAISGDTPAIFLYAPEYLFLTGKELHGVVEQSIVNPADRFAGVSGWYLKTTRVLK